MGEETLSYTPSFVQVDLVTVQYALCSVATSASRTRASMRTRAQAPARPLRSQLRQLPRVNAKILPGTGRWQTREAGLTEGAHLSACSGVGPLHHFVVPLPVPGGAK